MKKYWIIVNGQPQGPFTPEEIAAMGVASANLRVWYKGLPEWVPLSRVPELVSTLNITSAEPVEEMEVEDEEVAEAEKEERSAWDSGLASSASWGCAASSNTAAANREPMPSTYLPWNILATVCCCLPAGIIGIIFSAKVSRKYNEGDMEGARKASEAAAWCLMVSIVLGLVCWPFQMIFSGI